MPAKGDKIELQKQDVVVVACKKCGALMVNIDADQLEQGDLVTLKRLGVRISNPETTDPICLDCEIEREKPLKKRISNWYKSSSDDDSSFFRSSSSGGGFFGGGFGGFGGGGFSGGGASGRF